MGVGVGVEVRLGVGVEVGVRVGVEVGVVEGVRVKLGVGVEVTVGFPGLFLNKRGVGKGFMDGMVMGIERSPGKLGNLGKAIEKASIGLTCVKKTTKPKIIPQKNHPTWWTLF